MAYTVADILDSPHLQTRLHAGGGGVANEVRWAHLCDMPDPAQWLGPGDLLLSTGRSIPREGREQEALVERLTAAGIVGVAISTEMDAPPITDAMTAAAEAHGFPVMLTAFEVPFVALSRAVAEANQAVLREGARLTERLYNAVLRATAERVPAGALLATLGPIVGCELFIVDPRSAESLDVFPPPPAELVARLRDHAGEGVLSVPSIFRLAWARRQVIGVAVPSTRPAVLVAVGRQDADVDSSILTHLSTIVGLELERLWTERDRRRRSGSELLTGLVAGSLAVEGTQAQLNAHGLHHRRLRLLACATAGGSLPEGEGQLHQRLADLRIGHLLAERDGHLLVLIGAHDDAVRVFRRELDGGAAIGVSDGFERLAHLPDALHEAQLALQGALSRGVPIAGYGEAGSLVPFLPATLSEARRVAQLVLGPIVRHDEEHTAQLLPTLRAFLTSNRSWTRTAAALHVHKQTLVYRIRRVEELTGRRLDNTQDVVELWLALRAHELTAPPAG
jgi:purine catabolism regulator